MVRYIHTVIYEMETCHTYAKPSRQVETPPIMSKTQKVFQSLKRIRHEHLITFYIQPLRSKRQAHNRDENIYPILYPEIDTTNISAYSMQKSLCPRTLTLPFHLP